MVKNKIFNIHKKHTSKFVLFIYATLTLIIIYHLYYSNKIINGVVIGGTDLSGLSVDEAYYKLQNKVDSLPNNIDFNYQDSKYSILTDEMNFNYDISAMVNEAFSIGRSDNVITDSKNKLLGFFRSTKLNAKYDFDKKSYENEILKIKGSFNKPYTDATFYINDSEVFEDTDSSNSATYTSTTNGINTSNNATTTEGDDNIVKISPSLNGLKIRDEDFNQSILNAFNNFDFTEKELPVDIINPQIYEVDLEPLLANVQNIVDRDFKVNYESSNWSLEPLQKLDLISVIKDEQENIILTLNKATFSSFIDLIKYDIEILPKGKVQEDSQGMVVSFELLQTGTQIDEEKFFNDFEDSYFNLEKNNIAISTKIVDDFDIEKYGIFQLLGTGTSKYTGSGSTRVHNLTLAADRASGVLVPPQGIYSLNKSIGAINASTGYQVGYIISGGRTVLGEGGGVCQTSTTLFRAVLNAGLPIVMRYAHDYRVSYYEIESAVGFDAAIFQPSLDFRFKNDTPNYILVQSSYNLDESSLTFKIYGTYDGRVVDITEPIITNQTSAPAPLYQDDPTLPKGVVRQVDWSAPGANVSFSRTVKRDNETIIEDTFVSRYYPWRAIFLVGTKE